MDPLEVTGTEPMSNFIQKLENDVVNCETVEIMLKTLEEKSELTISRVYIHQMKTAIDELEMLQYTNEVQQYQEQGLKIVTKKQDLIKIFDDILSSSLKMIPFIQNYFKCYRREQQLHAIGIDSESQLVSLKRALMLTSQMLNFFQEIGVIIQQAIETFDVERIRQCNNENSYYFNTYCSNVSVENEYETNFQTCKAEFENLVILIYKKFSLIVTQQPDQVIQTKTVHSACPSITLLNFNNIFTSSIPIYVYLINEQFVNTIGEVLPDKIEICGTLVPAQENVTDEGVQEMSSTRKRRRQVESFKKQKLKYVSVKPFGMDPNVMSPDTGLKVENVASSSSPSQSKPPEFSMHLALIIRKVERLKIIGQKENEEKVTKEKYCFLFVAELPIYNQIVKAWTISLPIVVTTHASHNERAWATIAWDNAFPAVGRNGFEVQPTANLSQIREMLNGLFKVWVRAELKPLQGKCEIQLKPSHEKCIMDKLNQLTDFDSNEISWDQLVRKREDDSTSFWRYFYRAAMIVKGHLSEAWVNGYVEGFISWEEARELLIRQNKPGTFLVRFSDSEPGSISLVLLADNGNVYRMTPLEFYKQKSFVESRASLLLQLNTKDKKTGKDVFRWVYPDICKKVAFEIFYKPKNSQDKEKQQKPHYSTVRSVLHEGKGDEPSLPCATNSCDVMVEEVNENSLCPQQSLDTQAHSPGNDQAFGGEGERTSDSDNISQFENTQDSQTEGGSDLDWLDKLLIV
ncbi:unnamed protein product [Orchesella dallaii]|uniref:SH2 domain-containing protein n=1 Tax=Orchesella dallaii TaxID=48710 RepID=A0ABP1PLR2_9HEXA